MKPIKITIYHGKYSAEQKQNRILRILVSFTAKINVKLKK